MDARQASECRKQRLMRRIGIQKETQVVRSIDSNGTAFKLGNVVGAITCSLAQDSHLVVK